MKRSDSKILICGSRNFRRLDKVRKFVQSLQESVYILVGDARGVDREVIKVANPRLLKVYKADWETHGKKGGIVRNLEMLDMVPKLIVAFWNGESRGTKFMIDAALKRNINIRVYFDLL